MHHLPWQCVATILLACLLIQVNSISRGKSSKIKHPKLNNAPVRAKWNYKKGPRNSSAISSENIPMPNQSDKEKFLPKVHHKDHVTQKRPHMTGKLKARKKHKIRARGWQHIIKNDLTKSGKVLITERKTRKNYESKDTRKLYQEGGTASNLDRSIQDVSGHNHNIPIYSALETPREDIKIHNNEDRTLKSKYPVTGTVTDKECQKRENMENQFNIDSKIVESPAPVQRSLMDDLPKKRPVMEYSKTPEEREAEEEYIFEKWYLNKNVDVETRDINNQTKTKKKFKPKYPKIFGLDFNGLSKDHPHRVLRNGSATFTDTCSYVRTIEDWMRQDETMYVGINPFYVKFTEAYGIFIVGSANVTDHGLMRACYTLRVMLSSRYDIRNAYYKLFGRVALIGDGEQQTSLYEYSQWDPKYWDNRARGLGPTIAIPLTSAGDDNQRCKSGDRYFNQDIFVHEMGHAVHLLGATHVIPGFQKRLTKIFTTNVKEKGLWKGTYAATNLNEYFSVATQFYMNAFRGTSYMKVGVTDHDSLYEYDPDVYKLLYELYPCVGWNTKLIHRCSWKDCSVKNFNLKYNGTKFRTDSGCPVLKSTKKYTADECAQFTCYYMGNAFKYDSPDCMVLNCPDTSTLTGLMISQGYYRYDIYTETDRPMMNLKKEKKQKVDQLCVSGPLMPGKCKGVSFEERKTCGKLDKNDCLGVGCCYDRKNDTCYYPKQDCVDRYLDCYEYAQSGDCERNPVGMYQKCPFACNVCKGLDRLKTDDWKAGCQDKSLFCADWASHGECSRNPAYMLRNCELSCSNCTVGDPLK